MVEEKQKDEEDLESQDKEEEEEIENILVDLEEEELEEEVDESELENNSHLDDLEKLEVESPKSNSSELIENNDMISRPEVVSEVVPVMAEIEKGKNIEQTIDDEKTEELQGTETIIDDLSLDEIEKVQDESVKEKFRDLPGYIEALLFEVGKPLKESEIVDLLYEKFKADRIRIRWGLRKVMRALEAQNSSIQLINPTKDFWSFQLNRNLQEDFLNKIEKFIPEEEFISKRETQFLTEIAYRQPVSTTEILKILGADGYEYIRSLEDKDLIRLTKEGQSNILRTTNKFAQLFGFDPEMRSLKIQLVWRLKKLARSESARDKDMLTQLKKDREKYGS